MGDFRRLEVWKEAKDLAVEIYKITNTERFNKDFSLRDQIRRSIVSISSNIAEGDERFTNKESVRFLYIANGSVAEAITQLYIAYEIGYIQKLQFNPLIERLELLSKKIKTLIKYRSMHSQHPQPNTQDTQPKAQNPRPGAFLCLKKH